MCMTFSVRASAMIYTSPFGACTRLYSSRGLSAMARLPGSVQIVVVQMTKKSLLWSTFGSLPRSSCIGNFTNTVVHGSS